MSTPTVVRPGAPAVIVVPAGPGTYDYYDRFLGHERRYARHELSRKAAAAGLENDDAATKGGEAALADRDALRESRSGRRITVGDSEFGAMLFDALVR